MNLLTSIWNWFDGKKTAIGAACLLAVTIINQWIIGVNHFHPDWLNTVLANLSYVGETLTAVGIGHRIKKSVDKKKLDAASKPPSDNAEQNPINPNSL